MLFYSDLYIVTLSISRFAIGVCAPLLVSEGVLDEFANVFLMVNRVKRVRIIVRVFFFTNLINLFNHEFRLQFVN